MVLFFGIKVEETVCLTGPPSCGKSSILFQHALRCLSEEAGCVLYLCPTPFNHLPLLPQEKQPPPSKLLNDIHFKYPTTLSELQSIFDSLHLLPQGDTLGRVGGLHGNIRCIIVDDFHKYYAPLLQAKSHDLIAEVSKACAHIVDGVKFISSHTVPCTCILSLTQHGSPTPRVNIDIIQRWFPSVLKISECGSNKYSLGRWKHDKPLLHYSLQPETNCFEWQS